MKKNVAYILVFILLFFSGNPLNIVFGKYAYIIATVATLILIKFKIRNQKEFYLIFGKVLIFLMLIFIGQYFVLGFISWIGAFNFILKVFMGAIIVNQLQSHFVSILFKVVVKLTLFSLFAYFLINIFSLPFIGYKIDSEQMSYFIYTISSTHQKQNDGMFWEPGAFAGILTLTLVLNFESITYLWKNNRSSILILLMGILTTQSTTGYIITFTIFIFKFLKFKNKYVSTGIIFLFVSLGTYLYENTNFLKEKIDHQFDQTKIQDKTQYSNTRFGSVLFDWHYINKHPIVGNGFHESTRYADHAHLQQMAKLGENLGSGNGFSNFLASMGIPFMFGYFALIFLNFKKNGLMYSIIVVIILLLILQGEQWLNYPIFLSIPFILLKDRDSMRYNRISNNTNGSVIKHKYP